MRSSLSCYPALSGSPINIQLSFICNTFVNQGELITVSLPGFRRISGSGYLNLTGPSQFLFSNFYDNCSALLFLIAKQEIPPLTDVQIIIQESQGITSPVSGIAAESPLYTLSTNAVDILESPASRFQIVSPIGSFSQSSSTLTFPSLFSQSLAQAGEDCLVTFNLTTSMSISSGDTLRIWLPGFSHVFRNKSLPLSYACQNNLMIAVWDDVLSNVVVSFQTEVPAFTDICGSILGLALPVYGIQPESSPILISINASAGPVDWTRVRNLQPVGAFLNLSKIAFQPAKAGTAAEMNITLYTSMKIAYSSLLMVDLPMFSLDGPLIGLGIGSYVKGINASLAWNESNSQLTILLKSEIQPYQLTVFTIQSDTGLRLPVNGLRENETLFRISTNALDGPVEYAYSPCTSSIGGQSSLFDFFVAILMILC